MDDYDFGEPVQLESAHDQAADYQQNTACPDTAGAACSTAPQQQEEEVTNQQQQGLYYESKFTDFEVSAPEFEKELDNDKRYITFKISYTVRISNPKKYCAYIKIEIA